ncbi:hypothetical protein BDA96_02G386400 [Sorghum bicolor]|uniref:Uncharacterized protein n=1 Tax=Sorghum bicolor TaxID=4558 RepID=A0A921RTR5_SORBI|nr:uncharacterized protein LOC8079023 [Sorghum bicolor]KAG0545718.1 hypothetical protein BDA96_02G386400 [Sorghum bicolor]|eukprot:XP_002460990.1 uncharacterized protein LOC8079023 [Sorghum bicolor]
MAITETAARKLLHGGAAGTIAQGVADLGGISFGLWEMVTSFFADIIAYLFAALAGAAHLLVLPLEVLWQSLVTVVTTAAGAVASGLDGLCHYVTGFFAQIFAAIAGAAHLLVLPLETLWQWLATSATDAAGSIASGIDGLWQHVTGFLAHIFAAIAGAAHQFVLPLETLWQWLATSMTDAAGAISSGFDGLWQLVAAFLPGAWSAVAGAAHQIPQKLANLWRWLQAAAPVALPYVLAVAAVVLVATLVWFCWPVLLEASVGVGKALVIGACFFVQGLLHVGRAVLSVFVFLLPCLNCAVVTMKAPGAAGIRISRAAFEAAPALFFQILRSAPTIVAATVFCTKTVALLVAFPVAALFGAR